MAYRQGGSGPDKLYGTDNNDQMFGRRGNDTLYGYAGNDFMDGEGGRDQLLGGDGRDTLKGGDGNDLLNGGRNADDLAGKDGNDTLNGGQGNDTLRGAEGSDSLSGEDGDDTLQGGANNDTLSGDSGNDNLVGGTGDDSLSGGDDNDSLQGEDGNDQLFGDSGNDTLLGEAGNDSLSGGDDNDLIYGDDVNNTLQGNDTAQGGLGSDSIYGGLGSDSLSGGSGQDFLFGGQGNDTLRGEGGNDSLSGGNDNDLIYGDDGNDTLTGGFGQDSLYGGIGDDTFYALPNGGSGESSIDRWWGGSGRDTFHLSGFAGGSGYAEIYDFDPNQDTIVNLNSYDLSQVSAYVMVRQNGNTVGILNNTSLPQINGTVWNDLDNNGTRNNGEQGLSNWRVYLDQNRNNQWDSNEQSTFTNSLGNYSFTGLNPNNNYYVAVQGLNGWDKTFPSGNNYSVGTAFNQTTNNLNFGFRAAGNIEGIKWKDLNNDGIKSNNEPGFSGQLIYIDKNQNGQLDAGDISTTTDDNGFYSFEGLAPGNYTISEFVEVGWQSTSPKYLDPKVGTINVTYDELFPNEAKAAFEHAADIWESLLVTNVPLDIYVGWSSFPSGLASGSPGSLVTNFDNIPETNVLYPVGLANQLAGSDIKPNEPDIYVTIDSEQNWYLGTDGQTSSAHDLVTVALHEIGHGLGFFSLFSHNSVSGTGTYIDRWIYDQFLVNGSGEDLYDHQTFPNNSTALGEQLVSQNLFFDGENAKQANGGNPVKIHAPFNYNPSSSFSHLDNLGYRQRNALMTPIYNQGVIHNPDDIMLGVLEDLGWTVNNSSPSSPRTYSVSLNAGDTISNIDFSNIRINNVPIVEAEKNILLENNNPISLSISLPTDADGDNLIIMIDNVPDASFGEIQRPDGTLVNVGHLITLSDLTGLNFVPNAGLTGEETFGYTVSDGVNTASSTVTLSINQPPIVEPPKTLSTNEDTTINFDIIPPSDPENDSLIITVDSLPNPSKGEIQKADDSPILNGDILTIEELTSLKFLPFPDANGSAGSLSYSVNDSSNNLVSSSVSFDIIPVDDAPIVANEIADVNVDEDSDDTIINLSNVFTDIDNDDSAIDKSVFSNDNPSLVTATIVDNQLILDYQENKFGTANITIEGVSNGKSVPDSFEVTGIEDTQSPELIGLQINPNLLNTSVGEATVEVTLNVTDNLAGVQYAAIVFDSPSGQQAISNTLWNPHDLITGDALNGTYQKELTLPQFSELGTWTVRDISLVDEAGNSDYLDETELTNLGFDLDFEVINQSPRTLVTGEMLNLGEADTITLNHTVQTITLDQTYINPVIFAPSVSFNGSQPATPRITNVTDNSFDIYLQEPSNLDGTHIDETLSYLVFEAGTYQLSDGTLVEVGSFDTDATSTPNDLQLGPWQNVEFDIDFAQTPILFSQVQTYNESDLVRTRQQNATANGFEVVMEEEEIKGRNGETHLSETIGYVAIAPGTGTSNGVTFEAGATSNTVTHELSSINFESEFSDIPHFLAHIATYDGPDSSTLRFQNLSADGVMVTVQEDTSFDSEIVHTTEAVNYLALEGDNALQGTAYDPLTGNRAIIGTDGDEYILGLAENDTRTGKGGSDIFVLETDQGTDTITDFELGVDLIGLDYDLAFDDLDIIPTGLANNDTSVMFHNQELAVIKGVESSDLASDSFASVTI